MRVSVVRQLVSRGHKFGHQTRIGRTVQKECGFCAQSIEVPDDVMQVRVIVPIIEGKCDNVPAGVDMVYESRWAGSVVDLPVIRIDHYRRSAGIDALISQQAGYGLEAVTKCLYRGHHLQDCGRCRNCIGAAMQEQDSTRSYTVDDCGADLGCGLCSAPVARFDCPTDGVLITETAGGRQNGCIGFTHWGAEVRFCTRASCILNELIKVVEVSCQFCAGHQRGIFVAVGMVSDFVALGDDFVDQARISHTIQEESGFDSQQCEVVEDLPHVLGSGCITDGQGNNRHIGVDLVHDFGG